MKKTRGLTKKNLFQTIIDISLKLNCAQKLRQQQNLGWQQDHLLCCGFFDFKAETCNMIQNNTYVSNNVVSSASNLKLNTENVTKTKLRVTEKYICCKYCCFIGFQSNLTQIWRQQNLGRPKIMICFKYWRFFGFKSETDIVTDKKI